LGSARSGESARPDVAPLMDYFKKRCFTNATLNQMLVWMDDNQATGEQGAVHFLKTYDAEWMDWVSPEIAEKIKSSL